MLVCAALFSFLQPPSRASQKPTIRISNCPLIVIIVIVVLPVLVAIIVAIRFVVVSVIVVSVVVVSVVIIIVTNIAPLA